jgi:hypothetical protein
MEYLGVLQGLYVRLENMGNTGNGVNLPKARWALFAKSVKESQKIADKN